MDIQCHSVRISLKNAKHETMGGHYTAKLNVFNQLNAQKINLFAKSINLN